MDRWSKEKVEKRMIRYALRIIWEFSPNVVFLEKSAIKWGIFSKKNNEFYQFQQQQKTQWWIGSFATPSQAQFGCPDPGTIIDWVVGWTLSLPSIEGVPLPTIRTNFNFSITFTWRDPSHKIQLCFRGVKYLKTWFKNRIVFE